MDPSSINPGDDVLISIENPQDKTIGVKGTVIPISTAITPPPPQIKSVVCTGIG
jgi:hypothetical protein